MNDASARAEIADRLDRLRFGPLHLAILLVASLGLFIDIAELTLNAVFTTSFPDTMAFVPTGGRSILLGSVFAGGIVGAPLFGVLADRCGRRTAMQISMAMLALCSLAAALATGLWALVSFRLLAGVALGAYPPLMAAWLTDVLPPKGRARIILWGDALGFLGAPALVFAVYRLNGAAFPGFEGWRAALFGGAVIALFCNAGFWLLPESPRWLAARGRYDDARRALARFEGATTSVPQGTAGNPGDGANAAPPSSLSAQQLRKRFTVILVLYALRAVPTVVFPIMMGLALRRKGLDLNTSLVLVATSSFGGTLGTLFASSIVERVERRAALAICGLLLTVCGLVFAAADTVEVLLPASSAFLTLGAIFGPILSIYAAEIMPTAVRAATTSVAWGLTRLMSSILPAALLPLLAGSATAAFMAVVLGSVVVSVIIIGGFGPRQLPSRPIV